MVTAIELAEALEGEIAGPPYAWPLVRRTSSRNDAGFGGEYQAIEGIFLRAGYTTQPAVAGGSGFDAARGLTLGWRW